MINKVQDFAVWASTLTDDVCSPQELKHLINLISIFLEEIKFNQEEE